MRFSDLLAATPGVIARPQHDIDITAPVSESAQAVEPGGVFVARRGAAADGHDLIPEAVARGAAAVVGERAPGEVACPAPYAQVADGRAALGPLAAAYYGFPSRRLVVIGVTGTDGKTTVSTLIHSILNAAGLRAGLLSTVSAVIGDTTLETGLHVTTPAAHEVQMILARMVAAGMTHAVIEATSHGLAQERVGGVDFDVAVMTNVTHEHLDFHGAWEAYRDAKTNLFERTAQSARKPGVPKAAVINADDPSAEVFRARAAGVDRVLTYGRERAADVRAEAVEYGPQGTRFVVRGPDELAEPLVSGLVGPYNVYNTLAAVAAAIPLLDADPDRLRAALRAGVAGMPPIPGRMERLDEGQDFTALVDFAHTPNALLRALEAARTLVAPGARVIAIFGSAGLRDREKRRLMAEVGMEQADRVILTAEDPRTEALDAILEQMAAGCRSRGGVEGATFWRVPDRGRALAWGCALARPGDLVIACGKGHEQSMAFGATEYPWDDRAALRAALRGAPLLTLPTASLPGPG